MMPKPDTEFDQTLATLIRHAKRTDTSESTWRSVAKALEPVFGASLPLVDVMQVMVSAYERALAERRFALSDGRVAAVDLLLAPLKGHSRIVDALPEQEAHARFSLDQFYDAFVGRILGELRVAKIDWCKRSLWPTDSASNFPTDKRRGAVIPTHI